MLFVLEFQVYVDMITILACCNIELIAIPSETIIKSRSLGTAQTSAKVSAATWQINMN